MICYNKSLHQNVRCNISTNQKQLNGGNNEKFPKRKKADETSSGIFHTWWNMRMAIRTCLPRKHICVVRCLFSRVPHGTDDDDRYHRSGNSFFQG